MSTKLSDSPSNLIAAFEAAVKNPDKMRGWKRAFTLYKRNKSFATGRPEYRFHAAIKMQLTKAGYDTNEI